MALELNPIMIATNTPSKMSNILDGLTSNFFIVGYSRLSYFEFPASRYTSESGGRIDLV